jgi:hypothetical protein
MKVKNLILNCILLITGLLYTSCGESIIELGSSTYEPKIVIQGFLIPGQNVQSIYITKNTPLNTKADPASLLLSASNVRLVDLQTNKEYKLTFNLTKFSFEYEGTDLIIGYDKSYKLTVDSYFDGKYLSASSITRTPKPGFGIIKSKSISGEISYREKDDLGSVKEIPLVFNLSEGTTFYPISLVALQANDTTFIYDNAYRKVEKEDLIKNLDGYKYQQRWLQNVNPEGNFLEYDINWIGIWFYSKYRLIVYAGDENFRLFSLTHRSVQEFDGNFHEPKMNIQGDGIGVFGSCIPDTIYFRVKK